MKYFRISLPNNRKNNLSIKRLCTPSERKAETATKWLSIKNVILRILQISQTLALESLFNKVAGLIIAILIMVEHSNEEKVKPF